jgi:hypothetical protein
MMAFLALLALLACVVLLPLMCSCSLGVAALGPLSPSLIALTCIMLEYPGIFAVFALSASFASRQFTRWRRRRPPSHGRRRSNLITTRTFVSRILSRLLLTYLAFICFAAITRDIANILFGTSADSALHPLMHGDIDRLVLRNVLAQPVSHMHHAHTPHSQHADTVLTHRMSRSRDGSPLYAACEPLHVNTTDTSHMSYLSHADSAHAGSAWSFHDACTHLRACMLHTSSSSFYEEGANCIYARSGRKAAENISLPPLCFASHQSVFTPTARLSPVQWASPFPPAACTSLLHTSKRSIVQTNPVAAALRFQHVVHRSMGIIPALQNATSGLQHTLRRLRTDWATPAAIAVDRAWTAVVDFSARLGEAHAKSALNQVCDPTALGDMMHACMSGEAVVLSHVVSEMLSLLLPWFSYLVQFIVTFVVNNSFNVIAFLLFVIAVESMYWLMRWTNGYGLSLAEALREIDVAPETHRMAMRMQLYRSRAGRRNRRLCRVNTHDRPLRYRSEYAEPTTMQLRLLSFAVVLLIVAYAWLAVVATPILQSRFGTDPAAVVPTEMCYHAPDAWREAGTFVCGLTIGSDDASLPIWEQGGAAAFSSAIMPWSNLRSLWEFATRSFTPVGPPIDRSTWSDLEAWVFPGATVPLLISPGSHSQPTHPPFQTSSCVQPGVTQVIMASVSNLALVESQGSLTQLVFKIIGPLTALLTSAGLPKLASAVITICMGTWVSLLAAVLSQLSPAVIIFVIVNIIISIYGRASPVCATNVPPGPACNIDRASLYGTATKCRTGGSPHLNIVHREPSRGAKKKKTRRTGTPLWQEHSCGATEPHIAASQPTTVKESKQVSPVRSESAAIPSPRPAVSTGQPVTSAVERVCPVIPDGGNAADVMNQHVPHHDAFVARTSTHTVKDLIHWLEICSPFALYCQYVHVKEEEEKAIIGNKTNTHPTETTPVSSCTCSHVDCTSRTQPIDVGSEPDHATPCVIGLRPMSFWAFVIFVVKFPLSIVICICHITLFCLRLGLAIVLLPFVAIRIVLSMPMRVVRVLGVRLPTWLRALTLRLRPAVASDPVETEGMLSTGEDQQPAPIIVSDAAADDETCNCCICRDRGCTGIPKPTQPAASVEPKEAMASTDATDGAAEIVEESGMPDSTETHKPTPAVKKKPTSVPEIIAPRRMKRFISFVRSLPPISRSQRFINSVYAPVAAAAVRFDLAVCIAFFWSLVAYFGVIVAHACGYAIPIHFIRSLGFLAICASTLYCILFKELRQSRICMPVKVSDLANSLPAIRNSMGMALKQQLDAYIEKACTHHQLNNGLEEEFYISTLLHKAGVNSAIGLTMTHVAFNSLISGMSPLEYFLQRAQAERVRWEQSQSAKSETPEMARLRARIAAIPIDFGIDPKRQQSLDYFPITTFH